MSTRRTLFKIAMVLAFAGLISGTLACSAAPAGPRAWIDFPLDGAQIPVGTPVAVLAHAHAPDGVSEVLLSVNGTAYQRNPPAQPGAPFTKATLNWFPQQEGEYVLTVRAFAKNGQATDASTVRVRAIGKVTPTATLPPGGPPTLVTAPDLAIVSVEAVVAGYKGPASDIPFCNTRVVYRNAGTAAVPRDYTIQFHFDGVPTWANMMAGGLPAGASAEATFVYQFDGSHHIGINIDSTNVIDESSEANNSYTGPLLCGGPTPVLPPTITPTPTSTRTPTATPTMVTPPPPGTGCSGVPSIASLGASPATITAGQSSTLSWGAVTNADSVSIDHGIGGVATPGSAPVSPNTTTTYTLIARCGGNTATRQTTITVLPVLRINTATFTPTRTRTPTIPPPRDTSPPAIPNPQDPTGGEAVSCSGATGNVTLRWSSVTDPSGVTYYVKWSGGGQSGGWEGGGTSHSIGVKCGFGYTWQVRACDGAGNCSAWSGSASFTTGGLH